MTDLEYKSSEMHKKAMNDKYYWLTHNNGFNGPAYLNISANMFADAKMPSNNLFKPHSYYDVYAISNVTKKPVKVMEHERYNLILKTLQLSAKRFMDASNETDKKYIIKKVSRTAAEYTATKKNDKLVFRSPEDVVEIFGKDVYNLLRVAAKHGTLYRGYKVTRRYVEIDMNGGVIREL